MLLHMYFCGRSSHAQNKNIYDTLLYSAHKSVFKNVLLTNFQIVIILQNTQSVYCEETNTGT